MRPLLARFRPRRPAASDTGSAAPAGSVFLAPPRPDRQVYAIGDIHGRADLVEPLLERIDDHVAASGGGDPEVVFLGDYIDRGPAGAEVLGTLMSLGAVYPDRVTCLMGNHERMMLDFLDDPATGSRWLANGGIETLASFGMPGATLLGAKSPDALARLSQNLRASMPPELEPWLRALPLSHRSGTLWAIHAAADPALPMERQRERALLWGHPDFQRFTRGDGVWVVHGHTIVEEPWALLGRIAVDTGAYLTGRLTAAAIAPDGRIDFLST